ncbi:MAG: preprotein translocase subunit SecG [Bacilli bacterium]
MSALSWYDYILLVVSLIMIFLVVIQSSKEDGMSAFTGEKSELFANQKQRGLEKAINTTTTVLSIVFIVLTILANVLPRY